MCVILSVQKHYCLIHPNIDLLLLYALPITILQPIIYKIRSGFAISDQNLSLKMLMLFVTWNKRLVFFFLIWISCKQTNKKLMSPEQCSGCTALPFKGVQLKQK